MVNGPMMSNIIRYTLPLIATNILQRLYTTADNIVVGRFNGHVALAAVGSTSSLINLILNLCTGISIGANVIVAQNYGARNEEGVRKSIHTSVLVSIIGGLLFALLGFFLATPLLSLMDTPAEVLPLASLYMKIYFLGAPASMIYNFCAAILRGIGNTKRPLFFLTVSGIINIILNLVFVAVFHMGVAGVALATTISQYISMVLILVYMVRMKDFCRLELNKLKIYKDQLLRMFHVGIPSGIQNSVFNISNVFLQTAVNSFNNPALMAGSAAASQIENFVHVALTNVGRTSLTFTSQNLGARKIKKIPKVALYCSLFSMTLALVGGTLAMIFAEPLLSLFIDDNPAAIGFGIERMRVVVTTYFLNGLMGIFANCQRGMGSSVTPAVTTLIGACGLRILWIQTVFAAAPSLGLLYTSYPVTWFITASANFVFYLHRYKKLRLHYSDAESEIVQKAV
ncbi:MAG: MATE family efflux transporter [Clostridia bacterium]|nr:MATE family efflux transporter [Clostridia bacterium]